MQDRNNVFDVNLEDDVDDYLNDVDNIANQQNRERRNSLNVNINQRMNLNNIDNNVVNNNNIVNDNNQINNNVDNNNINNNINVDNNNINNNVNNNIDNNQINNIDNNQINNNNNDNNDNNEDNLDENLNINEIQNNDEANKNNDIQQQTELDRKRREESMQLDRTKSEVQNIEELKKKKPKKLTAEEKEKLAESKGFKKQDVEDTSIRDNAKKVHSLKYLLRTRKVDKGRPRSSAAFRAVQTNLAQLDEFMKSIKGRTKLTAAEYEIYEKLSLNVCTSCEAYKKQKQLEYNKRFEEAKVDKKTGKKKLDINEYEELRYKSINEVEESINVMRQDMFKSHLKAKEEEIQGKMNDKLKTLDQNLASMVGNPEFNDQAKLKSALQDTISEAIYNNQKLQSLKGDFKLMKNESFESASKRFDKTLVMSASAKQNILEENVTENLVNDAMEKIQSGKGFTVEDINKGINKEIKNQAEPIINQNNLDANRRKFDGLEQAKENDMVLNPKNTLQK